MLFPIPALRIIQDLPTPGHGPAKAQSKARRLTLQRSGLLSAALACLTLKGAFCGMSLPAILFVQLADRTFIIAGMSFFSSSP